MASLAHETRNGIRIIPGEDETEERLPEQNFCEEIRDYKNRSRSFHEFYAEAEGAYNRRSFDRDEKNNLEIVVMDACHYLSRYEGKKEWSKDEKAECSAIVDEILGVSEKMVGKTGKVELEVVFLTMYQYRSKKTSLVPLFKIYGNSGDSTFISKNRRSYDSLDSFLDNNDLPHSLVCAAREGRMKTYEIDPVLEKYPLVFFTVNYSKDFDVRSEHARVWSTVLKNTIVLDLPFLLVQSFFEHIYVQVKYFTSGVNYNDMITDSMKYKFYKFMDKYKNYIPMFGTLVNGAIITGFAFSLEYGLAKEGELQNALVLNGNVLPKNGSNYSLSDICSLGLQLLGGRPDVFGNSFPCFSLGKECCFEEIISKFKENKVDFRTLSDCSDIVQGLCLLGEKLLDMFAFAVIQQGWKGMQLSLKVILRILPFLIRKLSNKAKKPMNYAEAGMGNRDFTRDDGNYSLNHFKETIRQNHTRNDVLALLSDEENMKDIIESKYRECAADDSQFICFDADRKAYISLAPTSVVIEKLLESSRVNARMCASDDNSLYEISSEEALYKIYPFKTDKSNLEIHYIYVECRLSRSGQNI